MPFRPRFAGAAFLSFFTFRAGARPRAGAAHGLARLESCDGGEGEIGIPLQPLGEQLDGHAATKQVGVEHGGIDTVDPVGGEGAQQPCVGPAEPEDLLRQGVAQNEIHQILPLFVCINQAPFLAR